ncbi:unnamed protein product [Didymodactylos carnosus]|uniref:Cadherin domain-containing protein n=1 Tax=Didymodactylos carnosus TaxID=1234261 RepID=A0A8S2DJ82_9BILA|nr:unnamed protein product [Didymodactylos carnosus]CAF3708147.1 unnamed protein product [Didymodactylos carnosus]
MLLISILLLLFVLIPSYISQLTIDNTIYIHEEIKSNVLITKLNSNLQWLPASFVYQRYFRLENASLYTSDRIDREELCYKKLCDCSKCLLPLKFVQTISPSNISIITINILVEDINDHTPTFKQSSLTLNVSENVPVGYEISLEPAIDEDYGLLSVQTYELHPSTSPFRLSKSSLTNKPLLKLIEPLDRETIASYTLHLYAFDGGQPPLSSGQKLLIQITDINDNAPIFDYRLYNRTVPENETVGNLLLQVHATDKDIGENARITYSLDGGDNGDKLFTINEQTGEIFLKSSMDYEQQRAYTLTVYAKDHGIPPLSDYVIVNINVTDVNDNQPQILLTKIDGTKVINSLTFPECTPIGTAVAYMYVSDSDSGENGRVTCTVNDAHFILNLLTTNAYSLQIREPFDYEQQQQQAGVIVTCSDHGDPVLSMSQTLTILIQDCNDNAPEIVSPTLPFNDSIYISFESTSLPFVIVQLIVRDLDRFQPQIFSYTFESTPNNIDQNLILNNNGTLILHTMPTLIGFYSINISVTDSGKDKQLTTSIQIPIRIYSQNDSHHLLLGSKNLAIERTGLVLVVSFLAITLCAAILITCCFLCAFIIRTKRQKHQNRTTTMTSSKSICFNCCYSSLTSSSSCESSNENKDARSSTSNTSENEAHSSEKTTIEVLDEASSSNRIYQYSVKKADIKQWSDFNYSEKVERYLTHLNQNNNGKAAVVIQQPIPYIPPTTIVNDSLSDEGCYGSSDISDQNDCHKLHSNHLHRHQIQSKPCIRLSVYDDRPPSSIMSTTNQYQNSFKRFEQLYLLTAENNKNQPSPHLNDTNTSAFTSDSLYV